MASILTKKIDFNINTFFCIFHAWTLSFFDPWKSMIDGEDEPRTEPEHFTVPPKWVNFPSKVAFKIHEAKKFFSQVELNESGVIDTFRIGCAVKGCDVIAARSFNELESNFLSLLSEIHAKPVFPVGILPPLSPSKVGDDDDDNNVNDSAWLIVRRFLDKQEKGSTVFIAFGSELTLTQEEVTEIAFGLEISGLPFIWAFRNLQGTESLKLPEELEERVKGRGLVWKKWALQLKIMGHESIGGFMTHCGASSTSEAMSFGLPMIMMPFAIDQGLVARVFEDKMVGIEVPRNEEDGSFTRELVAKSMRLVVVEKEGEVYRENAKKMKTLFADKELHDGYLDRFIQFLENHRR